MKVTQSGNFGVGVNTGKIGNVSIDKQDAKLVYRTLRQGVEKSELPAPEKKALLQQVDQVFTHPTIVSIVDGLSDN